MGSMSSKPPLYFQKSWHSYSPPRIEGSQTLTKWSLNMLNVLLLCVVVCKCLCNFWPVCLLFVSIQTFTKQSFNVFLLFVTVCKRLCNVCVLFASCLCSVCVTSPHYHFPSLYMETIGSVSKYLKIINHKQAMTVHLIFLSNCFTTSGTWW